MSQEERMLAISAQRSAHGLGPSLPTTGGAIYEAMPKIMAKVKAVAKTKENLGQHYKFRGFDDIYAAVRLIMAEHGVFATHAISEHRWEERATKGGSAVYWVCAVFDVTFWASDGSSVVTQAFGEAMDSGDKAANKAMSMAMKYALVDTFLIPTGEPRDTENDHEGETETTTKRERPPFQKVDPPPREPAKASGPWNGEMPVNFGKHKGKQWADLESGYLTWIEKEMGGKAKEFASLEMGRRARIESEQPSFDMAEEEPPF